MYAFSSCPSFRILPPSPSQPVTRDSLISFLALGWAEHVRATASESPHTDGSQAAAAVLRAGAALRHSALVDHTLTAARYGPAGPPGAGGPASSTDTGCDTGCDTDSDAGSNGGASVPTAKRKAWARDVERSLFAFLNDAEFGEEGAGVPMTLPSLPSAPGASAGNVLRQATLLYAPDYGRQGPPPWIRVAAVAEGGGRAGAERVAREATWRVVDEDGPPQVVPWAQLPLLTVADNAVRCPAVTEGPVRCCFVIVCAIVCVSLAISPPALCLRAVVAQSARVPPLPHSRVGA